MSDRLLDANEVPPSSCTCLSRGLVGLILTKRQTPEEALVRIVSAWAATA